MKDNYIQIDPEILKNGLIGEVEDIVIYKEGQTLVDETGKIRDEQGRFIPGVSGNPDGRPPLTEEEKVVKKAQKELISEYKEKLAEALPLISPVLIAKAMEGDMTAIKEVNDRVMGKAEAKTDITSNGKDLIPETVTKEEKEALLNLLK